MQRALIILAAVLILAVTASHLASKRDLDAMRTNIDRLSDSVVNLDTALRRMIERLPMVQPGHLYHAHYSAAVPPGTKPVLREVDTAKNPGESDADCIARHNAAVAALEALYPPIL